jgi:hypothetical protein
MEKCNGNYGKEKVMSYINFNANDSVKVRLTHTGRKILAAYWGGKIPEWRKRYVDENGLDSFQFHELAYIFGKHLYNGNADLPFETDMKIEVKEDIP